MTNHSFSKLLIVSALSLGLAFATVAQSGKPTYRNQFPKDVVATLDLIQSLGFTEMEGGVPTGMVVGEYRKLLDARGINMTSTNVGYDELVKDPAAVATQAKALGASFVMVAWIPHERGQFNLDNAKKAVVDFNRAGKVLKDNGLVFCYHNHGYEFHPTTEATGPDATLFDYLVQNTNPAYVSFEMDVLWATHGGADCVKLLNRYGNRWKLMHLKDLKKGIKGDLTGGTPPENDVVLGAGQSNIAAVLKAAKRAGIKHYYIEDESNHEDINVPLSIAYLKGLRD
jgi:sugar phosphate isomerase/epimerase